MVVLGALQRRPSPGGAVGDSYIAADDIADRVQHFDTWCADFATNTCRLAQIINNETTGALTPVMYTDFSSGIRIGLLRSPLATTATSSLPLQHANGTAEHLLATVPLNVSPTAATLTETSAFQQNDRVDTNLVTHGLLVPVINVPVN